MQRDWRKNKLGRPGVEIVVEGVTYESSAEAARHYGMNYPVVHHRLRQGWHPDCAFTVKFRGKHKGQVLTEEKELDVVHTIWRTPGFMTYSPTEIEKHLGKHRGWIRKRLELLRGSEFNWEDYLSEMAPYFFPIFYRLWNTSNTHFLENRRGYEDATIRLLDAGKSKEYIRSLFMHCSYALNTARQGRRGDERAAAQITITVLELVSLWPLDDECPICSTKMKLKERSIDGAAKRQRLRVRGVTEWRSPDVGSLDRKENVRWYVSGNCGWLCWECNMIKGTLTAEKSDRIAAWIRTAE